VDLNHPDLKYGGEALALLGIAFRLASWAWRTKRDLEAPPGTTDADVSVWRGVGGIVDAGRGFLDGIRQLLGRSSVTYATETVTGDAPVITAPQQPPDTDEAPATLLDALTPAQRTLVLARLAQGAGDVPGGSPSSATSPPAQSRTVMQKP
jgi:hypothetical protein